MINIDYKSFLNSFEDFEKTIVPLENKKLKEQGKPPLTEDEKANLFIELREGYATTRKDPE